MLLQKDIHISKRSHAPERGQANLEQPCERGALRGGTHRASGSSTVAFRLPGNFMQLLHGCAF